MWEALVALSIVAALATTGLVYRYTPWLELLRGGAYLIAVGVLLSMLGGAVYHLMLYRALNPRGALRRGWYWNPTALHPALRTEERGLVLPWFYFGASALGLTLLGCAAVLMSVMRME